MEFVRTVPVFPELLFKALAHFRRKDSFDSISVKIIYDSALVSHVLSVRNLRRREKPFREEDTFAKENRNSYFEALSPLP